MEDSIKLHPKYGLNPTIPSCIICGQQKNEIVLLGSSYKDKAPMSMITSVEPCDDCKAKYLKDGVLVLECTTDDVVKRNNHQPTGRFVVITNEAFTRMFDRPILEHHICFTDIKSFLYYLNCQEK